jgi:oligopeptide transport system permease protein
MSKLFSNKKQAQLREHVSDALKSQLSSDAFSFADVTDDMSERSGYSNYSYWRSTFTVFTRNRTAMMLLALLFVLITFTFVQPLLPGQYDPATINNHPETGMQLSNMAPSVTTAGKTMPSGASIQVRALNADWYAVSNVLFSIQKRTKFTVVEYNADWVKVESGGKTGYLQNENIKLPQDPAAVPYEALSNFKQSVYADPPTDGGGAGQSLYVKKSDVTLTDAQAAEGAATTNQDTILYALPTSSPFLFGTNNIGQDLWARTWSGTRTSLFIGFMVALVEALIGILMGVIWGYIRKLDKLMTEIYNVMDNIPTTIVLILISYVLRPSISTLILAMCLTGWLNMALFIRNQIIIIRDREYNLASRCLGTSTYHIITRNLLPYLVSVIMLRMALAIPTAIGNEVFITYIGLGLPVSIPSLGNLINEGRMLITSPSLRYQLLFPAAVLSVITVSFYIIGNAFADAADPKNHI